MLLYWILFVVLVLVLLTVATVSAGLWMRHARKKYKSALDQLESLELSVSRQCRETFADLQLQIVDVTDIAFSGALVPLRPCNEYLMQVLLPEDSRKRDQLLPPPDQHCASTQVKL